MFSVYKRCKITGEYKLIRKADTVKKLCRGLITTGKDKERLIHSIDNTTYRYNTTLYKIINHENSINNLKDEDISTVFHIDNGKLNVYHTTQTIAHENIDVIKKIKSKLPTKIHAKKLKMIDENLYISNTYHSVKELKEYYSSLPVIIDINKLPEDITLTELFKEAFEIVQQIIHVDIPKGIFPKVKTAKEDLYGFVNFMTVSEPEIYNWQCSEDVGVNLYKNHIISKDLWSLMKFEDYFDYVSFTKRVPILHVENDIKFYISKAKLIENEKNKSYVDCLDSKLKEIIDEKNISMEELLEIIFKGDKDE